MQTKPQNRPLLLDGGLSTELSKKGVNTSTKLWSALALEECPQKILETHNDFLSAGADIISSCSYQASLLGFMNHGFNKQQAINLMKRSVQLGLEAIGEGSYKALLAVSLGPYGALLADGSEYNGHYRNDIDDIHNFHQTRIEFYLKHFEKENLVYAFETIPCLSEIKIIFKIIQEYQLNSWVSMSIKNATDLASSEPLLEVFNTLNIPTHLMALGFNCNKHEILIKAYEENQNLNQSPWVLYPNGGGSYDPHKKTFTNTSEAPSAFSQFAPLIKNNDIAILGGCCETTPKDIQSLRQLIDG